MLLLIVPQDIQTYMEESCWEHWCVQVRVNINLYHLFYSILHGKCLKHKFKHPKSQQSISSSLIRLSSKVIFKTTTTIIIFCYCYRTFPRLTGGLYNVLSMPRVPAGFKWFLYSFQLTNNSLHFFSSTVRTNPSSLKTFWNIFYFTSSQNKCSYC